MTTYRTLAICIALGVAVTAHAQDHDSLKARMSPEQFHAAGLDKLTPAELQTLQGWLDSHPRTENAAAQAAPAAAPVSPEQAFGGTPAAKAVPEPRSIEAHVVGRFKGWSRGTVLKLDNGQVWQVSDESSLYVDPMQSPIVHIRRGLFGSYMLKVEGYNTVAKVKRVQ